MFNKRNVWKFKKVLKHGGYNKKLRKLKTNS